MRMTEKETKIYKQMNTPRSIRGRYAFSIIVGIVITALIVSLSSVILIHYRELTDAAATMDLHCRREGDAVNDSLSSVEQSVIFMQNYAQVLEPDIDALMADKSMRDDYLNALLSMFRGIASETEGCMSYFFRYNPEEFPGEEGFLYSMEYGAETLSEGYSEMQITPIAMDDADDESYAWFFEPIELGTGVWISPHYVDDLKMKVITYAEPVYVSGKVVGVIGMDLDFDNVLQKIGKNRLYETGTVFLVGSDGSVMGISGTSDTDEVALFADALVKFSSNGDIFPYQYNGSDKRMVYCTLTNAMKLVITADASEIFKEERQLILFSLLAAGMIAFVLAVFGYRKASRITGPLRRLAEAAAQLDGRKLRVEVPEKERMDEIGGLARTLQEAMDKAQEYSDYIESLAYRDSLTGLNNRVAYDIRMSELDQMICSEETQFAIVMIDLNFLKKINDEFGHGMGNLYINNLCDKIKEVFPEDDTYRIGGDEFVVVLMGSMYEQREERIDMLRCSVVQGKDFEGEPWEKVSAAVGMAVYDKSLDTNSKTVFDRADVDMYARKAAMKALRE